MKKERKENKRDITNENILNFIQEQILECSFHKMSYTHRFLSCTASFAGNILIETFFNSPSFKDECATSIFTSHLN